MYKKNGNRVKIEDSEFDDWKVHIRRKEEDIEWYGQITAPMPLAAIHELFDKALARQRSPLLSELNPNKNLVYVSREFFRSEPYCNTPDNVTKGVLGFFSVVLSYAKNARRLPIDASTKGLTNIMPRTDWHTLHKLIEKGYRGELYDNVKILACYKNGEDKVE